MERHAADSYNMHGYKMTNNLFIKKDFISHSGIDLQWKIDCDALSDEDIETCAWMIAQKCLFGSVIGIPTGGFRLEKALWKYASDDFRKILIVDDVLTTGGSMLKEFNAARLIGYSEENIKCAVIFARGKLPENVTALFQCCV